MLVKVDCLMDRLLPGDSSVLVIVTLQTCSRAASLSNCDRLQPQPRIVVTRD